MIINNKISESPTLVFAEAVRKRKSEGKDIVSMGIGEPDIQTPPFLLNAVRDALRDNSKNRYVSSLGIPSLRNAIAKDLHERKSINYSPDQIVVTAGAKQAIELILFSILEPSDEVIFFTPCYVSYIPQILIAEPKAKPVPISLNKDFDIDVGILEEKINSKTKVIIINAPHNPTGKIFDDATLRKVGEIALRHNIYIILDDVYELLIYDSMYSGFSLASLQALSNLVFFVNSYSKSHAIPGWRLGYMCAPSHIVPAIAKIHQHINTNTCSLIQYAALSIYDNGYSFLDHYKAQLIQRREYLFKELVQIVQKDIFKPQGGFFYFIDISRFSEDSNKFCANLLKMVGVALTPGIAFGNEWNHFVRLSFGIDDNILFEGIDRIKKFISTYKDNK